MAKLDVCRPEAQWSVKIYSRKPISSLHEHVIFSQSYIAGEVVSVSYWINTKFTCLWILFCYFCSSSHFKCWYLQCLFLVKWTTVLDRVRKYIEVITQAFCAFWSLQSWHRKLKCVVWFPCRGTSTNELVVVIMCVI